MSEILDNFQEYTDTLVDFVASPNETAAEDLAVAEHRIADLYVHPVSPWDLSKGFRTLADSRDPNAVISVWESGLEGAWDDPADSLRRQARGALMGYGKSAPVSGAVGTEDLRPFFGITTRSMNRIGRDEPAFTSFGIERISKDLLYEARRIFSGYNLNPMSRQEALKNISESLEIVRYPYKGLGRVILDSYALLDRLAPNARVSNPFDAVDNIV